MPRKRDPADIELETRRALEVRDAGRVRPGGPTPAPQTPVGVIDRAVAVMDAVDAGSRSFTEIVETTRLSRTTAHRLIRSLEDHGFLFHVGGLGYALGPRLLGLATTAMRELPLRELAHPALERLARATGESAQLFVRDGDRRICVDAVDSDQELRTIVEVGAALPLTRGSAGKVLLAWGISVGSDDAERLAQQLATTRRRGWADSFGEREPGVASVSAPVFGPGNAVLAAISVSGPATRVAPLRAKAYAPAVMQAAREVESALGA